LADVVQRGFRCCLSRPRGRENAGNMYKRRLVWQGAVLTRLSNPSLALSRAAERQDQEHSSRNVGIRGATDDSGMNCPEKTVAKNPLQGETGYHIRGT